MSTKKFLDLSGLSRVWGKISDKFALKSLYGDTTINVGRKANTTAGTKSVAVGNNGTASGMYSYAEGDNAVASGDISHAEGGNTLASGGYSHAEGCRAYATKSSAHAEGTNTAGHGNNSHAEGSYTIASGFGSHAEGGNITSPTMTVTGGANVITYNTSDTSKISVGAYVRYGTAIQRISNFTPDTSITLSGTLSSSALNNATIYIYTVNASGDYSHAEGSLQPQLAIILTLKV